MQKVLNLYAGIGGNRKYWNAEVTAVELDPHILKIYQKLHPHDTLMQTDAHNYLKNHYEEYDFIWSSPPCQTHSKMALANKRTTPKYPNLELYEEIIFLQNYCTTPWIVENVRPYYTPLIPPTNSIGRHIFWSNFRFSANDIPRPEHFINISTINGTRKLMDWLDIHYEGHIYYQGNHDPCQILRNCVHPKIGQSIFHQAFNQYSETQLELTNAS